jgi:hypothetical protein
MNDKCDLDVIFITHLDSDHVCSLQEIRERLTVTASTRVGFPSECDAELKTVWTTASTVWPKAFDAGKVTTAGKDGASFKLMRFVWFFRRLPGLELRKTLDTGGEPPKGLLIDLLVPADRADDMLLALQKAFDERWVPKYGARHARCIFMTQSIGSIIGFWIDWMMKHLRLLKFFAS